MYVAVGVGEGTRDQKLWQRSLLFCVGPLQLQAHNMDPRIVPWPHADCLLHLFGKFCAASPLVAIADDSST